MLFVVDLSLLCRRNIYRFIFLWIFQCVGDSLIDDMQKKMTITVWKRKTEWTRESLNIEKSFFVFALYLTDKIFDKLTWWNLLNLLSLALINILLNERFSSSAFVFLNQVDHSEILFLVFLTIIFAVFCHFD